MTPAWTYPGANYSPPWPALVRPCCSTTAAAKGRLRARRMLTDMDRTQKRLAELLAIDRYAPTH